MTDTKIIDKEYVAGTYNRFPVEIVSGKGAVAYDVNGKKYIDMGSGIGVTAFGACDEEWKNAVICQLNKLAHKDITLNTDITMPSDGYVCQRVRSKRYCFA